MGTIDTMQSRGGSDVRTAASRTVFSLVGLWRWFDGRVDKARSRKALCELSDDQLRDIGISRRDAERESLQSFWN